VLLLAWLQYTFCELLDVVQASEMELRQALVDLNACVVHGENLPLCSVALLKLSLLANHLLHCALAVAQCIVIGHICLSVAGWVGLLPR